MEKIFEDLPPEYKVIIGSIKNKLALKIYSNFAIKYHLIDEKNEVPNENNEDKSNSIIERHLFEILQNFRFMTYCIYNPNQQNQNNKSNTISDLVNVIICVEHNCLIIDHIKLDVINRIFSKLKKLNFSLINVSDGIPDDLNEMHAKEEIQNFCEKLQLYEIYKNGFIQNLTASIVGYLIRRYFYPSDYFMNSSFFDFQESNEDQFRKEFFNHLNSEDYNIKNYEKIKEKYLEKEINKPNEFQEKEFIILRTIISNEKASFYLAIHIQSLHVFMMKKLNSFGSEHEKKFCKNYSHRCLTHFYGFLINEDKIIGFIYEYMSNGSLDTYISSNPDKINKLFVIMTIDRILEGLIYLHSNMLIHRDIKPMNILIDHNFIPYISDFDTIRHPIKEGVSTETMTNDVGSQFYSSPEQIRGANVSYPSDIFSFGLIIYFLYEKKNMMTNLFIKDEKSILPLTNASNIIKTIYKKCTKIKPNERFNAKKIKFFINEELKALTIDELFASNDNLLIKYFIYEFFMIQDDNIEIFIHLIINYFLPSLLKNSNKPVFKNKLGKFYRFDLDAVQNNSNTLNLFGSVFYSGSGVEQNYLIAKEFFELAAQQNNPAAFYNLGKLYYNGNGVEKDIYKAKEYYELAAEQNYSDALYSLGNLYYNGIEIEKNYFIAKEYFELAAKQNNSDAINMLGDLYYYGNGVEKDYLKAKECYEQAAQDNNLKAIWNLGYMYFNGLGVSKNYSKAKEYYEILAKENDSDALFNLGLMYTLGFGAEINYTKANEYYELAAKQNNSDALYNMGVFYLKGFGVKHNYTKAKELYELAAKQNCTKALVGLGEIYCCGIGVEKDFDKAKEYYELAAKKNDPTALYNLGYFYENEIGVNKDYAKAKQYYELAAKQNNPVALNRLAYFYETGLGVHKDYYRARECYEILAKQNYSNAFYKLGEFYFNGNGVEKNYIKAKEYYLLAANKSHSKALFNLGELYFNGYGVEKDYLKALRYYKLAANQFDYEALFKLGQLYHKGIGVKKDLFKAKEYYELAGYNNNPDAFYYLAGLYLKTNISKAIQYFLKSIETHYKKVLVYNSVDKYHYNDFISNNYYYHSCNDLGLLYLLINKDVENATKYIKEAAFGEYPFAQNNFGLLNEIYLDIIENADYMYQRASKHQFALAEFNIGHLKEKDNKVEESIEHFIKASDYEDSPLIFHNRQHNDKSLEISKTFIISYTNLKLSEYYFSLSDFTNAKKYFIKTFSKLKVNSYKFRLKIQKDRVNCNYIFTYIKNFILNSPVFDLISQSYLSSDVKVKIEQMNQIELPTENLNESDYSNEEILNYIKQIGYNKYQYKLKYFPMKDDEMINVGPNEIYFDDEGELFDFIISNADIKSIFNNEIKKIIQIMKEIIYTPPYPVLFGRIYLSKIQSIEESPNIKDINELFYEGLNLYDITK
ncbi:hypothetical protein M9Y10_015897 [Tritrichomonas musculus]|uniref:Protein kinase domain-containing protein n=1 Tax=Tritrichomonas musculus TaxID=1915356 RepID=A0ABR2I6M7_9EUKA